MFLIFYLCIRSSVIAFVRLAKRVWCFNARVYTVSSDSASLWWGWRGVPIESHERALGDIHVAGTRFLDFGTSTHAHWFLIDAVPKKRGPKTDVLEALLKRVDGLEAKLKEKNAESEQPPSSSESTAQEPPAAESSTKRQPAERDAAEPVAKRRATEEKTTTTPNVTELPLFSPQTSTTGWVASCLYILASPLLNTNRILITTIETPLHPPYRQMLFSTPISIASTTSLSTSWMKRSSGNAFNSTSFRPFCSTPLLPLPPGMLHHLTQRILRCFLGFMLVTVTSFLTSHIGIRHIPMAFEQPSNLAMTTPLAPGAPSTLMSLPLTISKQLSCWRLHIPPQEREGKPLC